MCPLSCKIFLSVTSQKLRMVPSNNNFFKQTHTHTYTESTAKAMLVTETPCCLTFCDACDLSLIHETSSYSFLGKRGVRSNPFPSVFFPINWSRRKVHLPNNLFEQNSCKSVLSIKSCTFPACREGKPFRTPV